MRVLLYRVRHDLLEDHDAEQMLQWQGHGGFSVHADVRTEDWDRPAGSGWPWSG